MHYEYRSAIGQDSHRFMTAAEKLADPERQLILAGIVFPDECPLAGNSDADVVLHALTNAISGLTGVNILGETADRLCLEEGITDSFQYLQAAMAELGSWQLRGLSISIEGKKPKITPHIPSMKKKLAAMTGLTDSDIGITATSGEGLTAFGRGEGLQVFCLVSARRRIHD